MLKLLSNRIKSFALKKYLIIFSIFFILTAWILNGNLIGIEKLKEITNGIDILDMKLFYNPDVVYNTLEKFDFIGRQFYCRILFLDFLFIISFAFFNSILISYLLKNLPISKKSQYLNALPFIRGFFDFIENIIFIIIIIFYPKIIPFLVWIGYTMTFMKWVTLLIIVITMIILIILNLRIIVKNLKMKFD